MSREFNWDKIPTKTGATADPAAGSDAAAVTVPAGKRWKLKTTYWTVVADGNAANRYWRLTITDGSNAYFIYLANTAITATQSRNISTGNAIDDYTGTLQYWKLSLPEFVLEAGYTFQIELVSIQAGDDIGPMRYSYQEVDA